MNRGPHDTTSLLNVDGLPKNLKGSKVTRGFARRYQSGKVAKSWHLTISARVRIKPKPSFTKNMKAITLPIWCEHAQTK